MKAATKARPERRKTASAKPLPRAPLEGASAAAAAVASPAAAPSPLPLAAPRTAPALALGHRHRSLLLPTLEALHLLAKVQRACASGAATLNRQDDDEGRALEPEGLGHVRHVFSEISEALLYLGDELGDIARQLTGEPHRATPLRHALALQELLASQRPADFRSEGEVLRRALEAFAPPAP